MTDTIFFFYFNGKRNEILSWSLVKEAPKNVGIFVYKWVYWWCGLTVHQCRLYNFTLQ